MYPISNRPKITDTELANGYVTRYFVKYISSNKIVEVDKTQYGVFKENPSFQTLELKWIIGGTDNDTYTKTGELIEGTKSQNQSIVYVYDRKMPGLIHMLRNPLEYFNGKRIPAVTPS